MQEVLIFAVLVVFVVVPLAVLVLRLIFKKGIAFTVSMLLVANSAIDAVLSYLVAQIGIAHLAWAATLAVLLAILSLLVFRKKFGIPLQQLADNLDKMAAGDLDFSQQSAIEINKSEIGQIARSFKKMTSSVKESVRVAELLSEGKLTAARTQTAQFTNNGKLNSAMLQMIEALTRITETIQQAAEAIDSGASEIASGSKTVAERSSTQAAALEEISSTAEEILQAAQAGAKHAEENKNLGIQLETNYGYVRDNAKETSEQIVKVARKITEIEQIAQRTSILAINAAIEAARAGDSGRGFAVVATEVRKLAEQSKQSAAEIIPAMQTVVKKSEINLEKLLETVPNLSESVRRTKEISSSATEQSLGIKQIHDFVNQLTEIAQENSGASEEFASSSAMLLRQAAELRNAVGFFE